MGVQIELKKGDACPICGQPIETDDLETLKLLSDIASRINAPGIHCMPPRPTRIEWPEDL